MIPKNTYIKREKLLIFFFLLFLFLSYFIYQMSCYKKNSTLFLYALFALLMTMVNAAPLGSIDDGSATLVCKQYLFSCLFIGSF